MVWSDLKVCRSTVIEVNVVFILLFLNPFGVLAELLGCCYLGCDWLAYSETIFWGLHYKLESQTGWTWKRKFPSLPP